MPEKIYIKRGGHLEAEYIHTLPTPDCGTKYIRADLVPAITMTEAQMKAFTAALDALEKDKPRLRELLNESQVLMYEPPAVDLKMVLEALKYYKDLHSEHDFDEDQIVPDEDGKFAWDMVAHLEAAGVK